jgi:hypothetical protein
MTIDHTVVDTSTPGVYPYTVSCDSPCSEDTDVGFVAVIAPCAPTAQDFTICQGTTVDSALFTNHGVSCSQPASGTMTVVSDTDTFVTYSSSGYALPGNHAELAWVHSTWWSGLSYDFGYPSNTAQWIWESYRVQNPIDGDIVGPAWCRLGDK